jgi:hypothetical protein
MNFVRDVRDEFETTSSYDSNAELPDDAVDTGWRDGDRGLWVDASVDQFGPLNIYIVSDNGVERWPRFDGDCG